MRKVFASLLLMFRWLLVPTLPVLGLLGGIWLRPASQPVWERTLEGSSFAGSIVTDEETTSLCVLRGNRDVRTYHYVIEGLDVTTGKELHSTMMTRHFPILPITGTTLAISSSSDFRSSRLILFDWKNNIDVADFSESKAYPHDLAYLYKNHLLVGYPSQLSKQPINFWHIDKEPVLKVTFSWNKPAQIHHIQLSSSCAWVVVLFSAFDDNSPAGPRFVQRVQLIDTNTGKVVQPLPDDIEYVNWHPEGESFLALRRDATSNQKYWQRYSYEQGQGFHETGQIVQLQRPAQSIKQTPSPYIVLASLATDDPWRIKLSSWLGKAGSSWLQEIWPTSTTLSLHHRITGEELNSLTVPSLNLVNLRYTIHPDPSGRGLILEHQGVFAFWTFHPMAKWYPWLGLCIGILLSIFVARWKLHRSKPAMVDLMAASSTTGLNS